MSNTSSSGRNFRRRGGDTDDDDQTHPTSSSSATAAKPAATSSASTKPKKVSSTPPTKSLLSFADDEDADESPFTRPRTTAPTKPTSNHKLSLPRDRVSSKPSNVQPQAGTYTKEALLELLENTRTLAAPTHKLPASEPVIVLKWLVKPEVKGRVDVEEDLGRGEAGEEEEDCINVVVLH